MDASTRESMMFSFDKVTSSSANLIFEWENTSWIAPITIKTQEMAIANIKKKMDEVENPFRLYNSSAQYYMNEDIDIDQALAWSLKSVEMTEKFWNVYNLSLIYAKKGDKKMAIKTAEKSMKLAEEAEYAPYVKLNKENIEKWSK